MLMPLPNQFQLQMLQTNGITVRAAIEGEGPLVIMVHGWPELWYSWRHQIKPIAEAGFKVLAFDVRGYGGSDKPHAVEAYVMQELMNDIIGLIDSQNESKAILIGHDWGAPMVWNTAALYPERVAAVAGLSVPYRKRAPVSTIDLWRKFYAGRFFYQLYFQQEGVAEREIEADLRTALRKIYYSISGDAPSLDGWLNRPAGGGLLDGMIDPDQLPEWLNEADLDYFVENFVAGGLRGPINRYRNQTRDFETLAQMGVAPVHQPSCFIAGSKDVVRRFVANFDAYADVDSLCTDMRVNTIIEGAGHWVQQEAADAVNTALIEFLTPLRSAL